MRLSDGLPDAELAADAAASRRMPLDYPFEPHPGPGLSVDVAPGVKWLRLPLPFYLNHINVWALRDGEGWTIVDTGVRHPETIAAWETMLAGPLEGLPVRRVIVTHMHPDHVGMAGWFTRRFGCRLWMSRLEYITGRMLVADTGRPAPEEGVRFYRGCGWSDAQIDAYQARFGGFGKAIWHMPDAYRRLEDGDFIDIGGDAWRVVIGNGHSPEHACLYRASDKVLISGDQVLPKISSNVSVWPTEPEGDPLTDWLTSLAKLKRTFPEDTLVLPSHGEVFRGLHGRLDNLERGHERSLERLLRLLQEPKRTVDVFGALFARAIGDDLIGMATGEALAHLNCLKGRGLALNETDADGVVWWRAA